MNSRLSFALALCMGVLVFSHADADHHKKKNKDNGAQLEQCTIQSSGSGMGCVAPLKLKCEKMKNGQKCCGCVGDKNAKVPETPKETPKDEPSKQYCEGYGNMNGVDYFKANCTGQHSGTYDCRVDSLNPTTHYHCCCYYH